MTANKHLLTVSRFQRCTRALGPGVRCVVWFHGCSFNCPGCIAAEMNSSTEFLSLSASRLADAVMAIPEIEGVTLSGGDPFDQNLEGLSAFLEHVRTRSKLSTMCYTGRTLSQLRFGVNASINEHILSMIDVLVDGLYVDALNDGIAWRGSSNQQVHFLTSRYRHLSSLIGSSHDRVVEVSLDSSARLHITGIPPSRFMERLSGGLLTRGLSMLATDKEAKA
jgi:anaerobic ribonucleoside-triphosphate reductase activating protein